MSFSAPRTGSCGFGACPAAWNWRWSGRLRVRAAGEETLGDLQHVLELDEHDHLMAVPAAVAIDEDAAVGLAELGQLLETPAERRGVPGDPRRVAHQPLEPVEGLKGGFPRAPPVEG